MQRSNVGTPRTRCTARLQLQAQGLHGNSAAGGDGQTAFPTEPQLCACKGGIVIEPAGWVSNDPLR